MNRGIPPTVATASLSHPPAVVCWATGYALVVLTTAAAIYLVLSAIGLTIYWYWLGWAVERQMNRHRDTQRQKPPTAKTGQPKP